MTAAERFDEILEIIDTVLGGPAAGDGEDAGATPTTEADREWTGLVRWGVVPRPVPHATNKGDRRN